VMDHLERAGVCHWVTNYIKVRLNLYAVTSEVICDK